MSNMNSYIVYKHTNKMNGKVYIGITCQKLNNRWRKGKGYGRNTYIRNAIDKHGWDNFKHEILLENLTETEARKKETELISLYKSNEEAFGYNLTEGGEHNIPNQVIKDKISKTNKAKMTEERRQMFREIGLNQHYEGKNNPFYGKHHDETTRKHMSENHWSKSQPERFKNTFCNKKGENNPSARKVVRLLDGKIYNMVSDCANDNNIKLDTVTYHCKNRRRHIEYMYLTDYEALSEETKLLLAKCIKSYKENPAINNPLNKKIVCLNDNIVYLSVNDCANQLHKNIGTIISHCKGRVKNRQFMYLPDYIAKYGDTNLKYNNSGE